METLCKVLIYGGKEWGYGDVCEAISSSGWKENITHVVTRNSTLFKYPELWAKNNGKVVIKSNPSFKTIEELGWKNACKVHNKELLGLCDVVILLPSPTSPAYKSLIHTLNAVYAGLIPVFIFNARTNKIAA